MTDNGLIDRFSVEAWNQHNIREIEVGDHLGVRYRLLDPTQFMLTGEEDFNPFLNELVTKVFKKEGEGQFSINTDVDLPDIFGIVTKVANAQVAATLHKRFDAYLIKAILSPPLVEQGHEVGVSIAQIPLMTKVEIFVDLIGGQELVAQLKVFLRGQGQALANRSTSETVRADARRRAGSKVSGSSVPVE